MTEAPKSLRAFYGASDRQRAHDNTVKSMACPGERPQVELTPTSVLERIPWIAEGVALDPCYAPGSIVNATYAYYVPPRTRTVRRKRKGEWIEIEETYYEPEGADESGLHLPWFDRTYCNPVFARLEEWLAAAVAEHVRVPGNRITMLAPVRTHRKWFRAALDHCSSIDMLDPVTFLGHDSSFPAPLWLLHFGG
jgi:hypothetical protein